jgi:RNA polymerase-binding transcription factor DksA
MRHDPIDPARSPGTERPPDETGASRWGICDRCGEKIPLARLRASATARYCARCQAHVEAREAAGGSSC